LQSILDRPKGSPHGWNSLAMAESNAALRKNDYGDVLKVLETLDEDGANAEYDWIHEYLRTEGNQIEDLAQLLVSNKYDSPFILRPDYFRLFLAPDDGTLPNISFSQHATGCAHGQGTITHHGPFSRDIPKPNSYRRPVADLSLGLAGFFPMIHDRNLRNRDDSILHEIWLSQLKGHVQTHPNDDSKLSICYGEYFGFLDIGNASKLKLAEQTVEALRQFLKAVDALQRLGIFCHSLPILWKIRDGSDTLIRVINIKVRLVSTLLENLNLEVRFLKENKVQWLAREASSYFPNLAAQLDNAGRWENRYLDTLSSLLKTLPLPWGSSSHIAPMSKVQRIVEQIFAELRPNNDIGRFMRRDLDSDQAPSEVEVWHYAASCVQMLCLGLQSSYRANIGMLRFPLLENALTEVHLIGCKLPTRKRLVAYLQELTCFAGMTEEPVLVFEACDSPRSVEEFPIIDKTPCDLYCSLEDVINIWGQARVEPFSTDSNGNYFKIRKMYIGGGVLFPADPTGSQWHWASGNDPDLPKALAELDEEHSKVLVDKAEIQKEFDLTKASLAKFDEENSNILVDRAELQKEFDLTEVSLANFDEERLKYSDSKRVEIQKNVDFANASLAKFDEENPKYSDARRVEIQKDVDLTKTSLAKFDEETSKYSVARRAEIEEHVNLANASLAKFDEENSKRSVARRRAGIHDDIDLAIIVLAQFDRENFEVLDERAGIQKDFDLAKASVAKFDEENSKFSANRRDKVRIGTVLINQSCPLSTMDGQVTLRQTYRDRIKSLQTVSPYWKLNSIQAGIQGGQYLVPQFMVGLEKMPGQTEKDSLLNPSNNHLLPELSNHWGLRACLCTGLMQRVSLQELIASRITSYIESRGPKVSEWSLLEEECGILEAFRSPGLEKWFKVLRDDLQGPAWMLIKEILFQLQSTGIDQENTLRLGWVQDNNAFKCLKIPCYGGNLWAKILTDSCDVATFACVTDQCLESSSKSHVCQGSSPADYNPVHVFQLSTRVHPVRVDYNSRVIEDTALEDGKEYSIGQEDLMLKATATVRGDDVRLTVKRSKMPIQLFRRLNSRAVLQESSDRSDVECMIGVQNGSAWEKPL